MLRTTQIRFCMEVSYRPKRLQSRVKNNYFICFTSFNPLHILGTSTLQLFGPEGLEIFALGGVI